jgi:hypothetical protein
MEHVYDDDVFMDDEIIEALHENPLQHQYIEENVQKTEVSPSTKNEERDNLDVDFHISSPSWMNIFPSVFRCCVTKKKIKILN